MNPALVSLLTGQSDEFLAGYVDSLIAHHIQGVHRPVVPRPPVDADGRPAPITFTGGEAAREARARVIAEESRRRNTERQREYRRRKADAERSASLEHFEAFLQTVPATG